MFFEIPNICGTQSRRTKNGIEFYQKSISVIRCSLNYVIRGHFTKKFLWWWVGGRCLNGDLVIRFAKPINMCFIKEISFQEVEKLKLSLQIKCSSAIWLQAIWSSTCFATFFLPMCTNFLGCPQSKVVFYLYDN